MVQFSRKLILSTAAAATMLGAGAPAFAGGGHYNGRVSYHSGHYSGGHNYYGHRRHHRRGHGGNGAAIALGIIGGAIILNGIAEERARDRYARDRYYEARYRDRYARPAPYDPDARDYDPAYEAYEDPAYEDGPINGALSDDDLDARLAGRADGGPAPIRYSAAGAYKACIVHARAALSERGFILAGPAEPETAEDVGGAWKMTANVTASDTRGAVWTRAMYCEADEGRVYLLELI